MIRRKNFGKENSLNSRGQKENKSQCRFKYQIHTVRDGGQNWDSIHSNHNNQKDAINYSKIAKQLQTSFDSSTPLINNKGLSNGQNYLKRDYLYDGPSIDLRYSKITLNRSKDSINRYDKYNNSHIQPQKQEFRTDTFQNSLNHDLIINNSRDSNHPFLNKTVRVGDGGRIVNLNQTDIYRRSMNVKDQQQEDFQAIYEQVYSQNQKYKGQDYSKYKKKSDFSVDSRVKNENGNLFNDRKAEKIGIQRKQGVLKRYPNQQSSALTQKCNSQTKTKVSSPHRQNWPIKVSNEAITVRSSPLKEFAIRQILSQQNSVGVQLIDSFCLKIDHKIQQLSVFLQQLRVKRM